MPEGMPYHLETGPTLGVLERRLNNATKRELLALRAELLSRKPLEDVLPPGIAGLLIPVPTQQGGKASAPLGVRLRQAWLGVRQPLRADEQGSDDTQHQKLLDRHPEEHTPRLPPRGWLPIRLPRIG